MKPSIADVLESIRGLVALEVDADVFLGAQMNLYLGHIYSPFIFVKLLGLQMHRPCEHQSRTVAGMSFSAF